MLMMHVFPFYLEMRTIRQEEERDAINGVVSYSEYFVTQNKMFIYLTQAKLVFCCC